MTKEKIEHVKDESPKKKIYCGLIMPLAPMQGYSTNQFNDVQSILIHTIQSISEYNFIPRMVSESAGEIDIIHNSIVNNIYDDPIVVVDISGRNGNVMLELGLRLAFDKPVIIVKDDRTDYMFDISMIEHVTYPADLRHTEILKFQLALKEKIIKTYEKSLADEEYSPFLKNFKHIKVKPIGEETIGQTEALSRMDSKIDMITKKINNIHSGIENSNSLISNIRLSDTDIVNDLALLMQVGELPPDIDAEGLILNSDFQNILSKYKNLFPARGINRFEIDELLNTVKTFIKNNER